MSCPDDRAGRQGRCPQCQSLFQVPTPDPEAAAGTAAEELVRAEEIVEFYCPNEHYLTAPARLEGKRGACPKCGARFRVPSRDEPETSSDAGPGGAPAAQNLAQMDNAAEQIDDIEEVPEQAPGSDKKLSKSDKLRLRLTPPPDFSFVEAAEASTQQEEVEEVPSPPRFPPAAPDEHPMAALFERIWESVDPEAVVEIYLADGQKIAPLHFAHDLSRGQQGVFAITDRNGVHTLMVVPWENVARVAVSGLTELPPGMFD